MAYSQELQTFEMDAWVRLFFFFWLSLGNYFVPSLFEVIWQVPLPHVRNSLSLVFAPKSESIWMSADIYHFYQDTSGARARTLSVMGLIAPSSLLQI